MFAFLTIEQTMGEKEKKIGMGFEKLRKIGTFFIAPGYSTELMHAYIATGLFESPLEADSDEFLSTIRIPIDQIPDMIQAGKIIDGKTLAVFQLAKPCFAELDQIWKI